MLSILETRKNLLEGRTCSLDLVRECLKNIKEKNKDINAFLSINPKAEEEAKEIDKKIKQTKKLPGLLAGIPLAIKDNILVKGMKATAGSKMLKNYFPPYESTVVKKLREAGAIILGKTNLDEFAMGSSTENSYFGPTKNPYDLTRVAGGSSGGSAAAVASEMCFGALGSDTGGSIRQPASFCGVWGLKPTYGRVSRFGLIAMASSLDQIGPLAKNVDDLALLLKVIEGKDEKDSTSEEVTPIKMPKEINLSKIKIGFSKEFFNSGLDKNIKKNIFEVLDKIKKQGAEIEEINLPYCQYALSCYYLIMSAEASSNLARYDGFRYGGTEEINLKDDLLKVYTKTRTKCFGDEVKRRLIMGTFVLSSGFQEKYYLLAQKVRDAIRQDFENAFKKVDFILTPTTPQPAFKIGEKISDPLTMYLEDIYTVPVNLAGMPALSMPVGKIKNLPVGLQIIGGYFKENEILSFAKSLTKLF
jgi:aspartyl-tRNA(Asn)/glutamyl-tRNA(Gln) amidotransferase subunit A